MSEIHQFLLSPEGQRDALAGYAKEVSASRNRLAEIRRVKLIECCGVTEIGRGDAAKIVIIDRELFDELDKDEKATVARVAKIKAAFAKLDEVIGGCEIYLDVPTPNGIAKEKQERSNQIVGIKRRQRQLASDLLARDTRLDPAELMNHPEMRSELARSGEVISRLEAEIAILADVYSKCLPILGALKGAEVLAVEEQGPEEELAKATAETV